MSLFIVTYWTGATQTFDCMTIRDAASLAGYSEEACLINQVHLWENEEGIQVTNSDGEGVAVIVHGGNDPDVEVIDSFGGKPADTISHQDSDDDYIAIVSWLDVDKYGIHPAISQNWPIPTKSTRIDENEIDRTMGMFNAYNVGDQFRDSEVDICMVMTRPVSLNAILQRSLDEYAIAQGNVD